MNQSTIDNVTGRLIEKSKDDKNRITIGVKQVANFWTKDDGDAEAFEIFCLDNFISDPEQLELTFARFERNFEIIWGHAHEVGRDLSMPMQLEMNPLLDVDYLFAEYDPYAHIQDDMFKTKIAFVVLLNFPMTTG